MNLIYNPILPGFHPDPSIVRVAEDYYIANSTFEWFPGVLIHHSRDLVHWRPLAHALTRRSQLNLMGAPDSGGVWAPALSYDGTLFYLIYTDQKSWDSRYGAASSYLLDSMNYLVTAERIEGPWSKPVFLNASGFDPSLFHDDDGRKWLLNMLWDHRQGKNHFAGIVLQEYCPQQRRLTGPVTNVFAGSNLRVTEGPQLLKRNGYYYLVTAEGGTSYDHAVTVGRSRSITGPYELHPRNPILTSAHDRNLRLQKAGHGSFVQTSTGEWFIAHLCSRPIGPDRRCPLGRETAIQPISWTAEDWPILASGGREAQMVVPAPALPSHPFPAIPDRDDFDRAELGVMYQTLRDPAECSWINLTERQGYLRLYGRQSMSSRHQQSLVGRRLQSLNTIAATVVDYAPQHFQQMAGLALFYDVRHYYYLAVTYDEQVSRCLRLFRVIQGNLDEPIGYPVPFPAGPVRLQVDIHGAGAQFRWSSSEGALQDIGPVLDMTVLSDDFVYGFTGVFVTLGCQDLSGAHLYADFDFLDLNSNAA